MTGKARFFLPRRTSFVSGAGRLASAMIELGGSMAALVEGKKSLLGDLCRRYGVRRLELFGSGATAAFDPESSDLDFLVEFLPEQDLGPWLRHYFEFQDELARLFERPV